jgi:hypothetical protein
VHTDSSLQTFFYGWIALGLATILLGAVPSAAQPRHVDDPVFVNFGNPETGVLDYTLDDPIQKTGPLVDVRGASGGQTADVPAWANRNTVPP